MQRISRLRTFERVETGKLHTALSQRPGLTIEEPDKAGFYQGSSVAA